MSSVITEINEYLQKSRQSNAGYIWGHVDLYPSGSGARELRVAFSRKLKEVSDEEHCLFFLVRRRFQNVFSEQFHDQASKAICLWGKPKIEFEQEDGEGFFEEAELDDRTSLILTQKAREIMQQQTSEQKIAYRRHIANRTLDALSQHLPAADVAAIKAGWLGKF